MEKVMKNQTRHRTTILFALLLQVLPLAAQDFHWDLVNALARGEMQKIDQLLSENINSMGANEKRLVYNFVLTYTRDENTLTALELLLKYGIHPSQYDLYSAINNSHTGRVVDFILNRGTRPNGEILLLAAEKRRWDLVRQFAEMGAEVNYKYPQDKPYADGMTALIHAAKHGSFETVRLLVERGANVNFRTNTGVTAASIAYENGEMDIYAYLLEHGALEVTANPPRQTGDGGSGISALIENGPAVFRTGTYRLSGGSAEIKLSGGVSGSLSYKNSRGNTGSGTFLIAGSVLAITMEGRTFNYRIDTNSAFSGNGETWVRVGD
jgi:hypothetical protein